jgi:Histidine kinase-, DNA gyrase B-, and HSP90-like ATPase
LWTCSKIGLAKAPGRVSYAHRPPRFTEVAADLEACLAGWRATGSVPALATGEGILPDHLAVVFSHGFTTKSTGHGFGLHTCANSMIEMGGRIAVASDGRGLGATFTLTFGAADAPDARPTSPSPPARPAPSTFARSAPMGPEHSSPTSLETPRGDGNWHRPQSGRSAFAAP